ncbi:GDH/6PGL endoplasmic bifunctional protein [Tympanuchus pallidicinctus]|uniref:GDH/6PGL endoplasmic bifunctional protein n=1 Tax=Tympanuchus pallidicinctus TaxID=109042 RepID=UPI0022873CF4|nr:GDH/6PGL endoplasmic bifunctional protein [Tympanuchus pallidicinctus]XP_052548100.1 GDH/6PGL endoplasmic bifunctional protein [Tympanuchus pallidicinctus]XP_052548101.1 GDH/6PGL endoplasmic bifunctional protein [Tympanuchus pallidicinctus]
MLRRVLCTMLLMGALPSLAEEPQGHISVVLLGATGDLAKKYLWQGLFQLYIDQVSSGHSFTFHGAALTGLEPGQKLMFDVLKKLTCPPDESPNRCAVLKDQFLKLSQYHQLKTAENYTALNREIEVLLHQEGLKEAGRIFYFSVPPFAYTEIARHINSSCRPPPGAWLRVVLEKPFGHDLESAQQMAAELTSFFREEEMYRVDHYLGKQAVAHILPFRDQNRQFLDPIWNRHHVERVEIVLKEVVDAKGRTSFYEQYGVIRDVLQNHLTEALMFLTMELPGNLSKAEEVLQCKLQALQSLRGLEKQSVVLGQYQAYASHVQEELQKGQNYVSTTPTFAGVLVHSDSLRWEGVPFLLTSGKALDERVGYVRVLFKNRAYCTQSEALRDAGHSQCKPKQIVFYIGHGVLNTPAVLVSRNLFRPIMPKSSWREVVGQPDLHIFGQLLSDYYVYSPVKERDAYSVLISNIYHGRKDFFITTENLLASWAFWTPLLNSISHQAPRLYPGGVENQQFLDFEMVSGELTFTVAEPVELLNPSGPMPSDYKTIQSKFRKSPLVSAWSEVLISQLASDVEKTASRAVARSGQFHLALSGGSSPVALFQRLARHHYDFPWRHTHLWLVDERCVPLTDPESNFFSLHNHLLQNIRVPYFNVHPMPVHLHQRLCVEEDGGTELYAKEIVALVANASFDLVLLGVGTDGHTASLFPHSENGLEGAQAVVLTESPVKPHQRMSLTLPLINKAQQVFVLVMGKGKHDITMQISRVGHEPRKWPISGVSPSSGQLVWYVDYEALLG